LVNIIHDEIVIECPEAYGEQARGLVEDAMKQGFLNMFPQADYMLHDLVEAHIGPDWDAAK
jgi:DNA polymerase I-like protein with 3'-5' exonuclease and polymerase domains